MYKYVKAGCKDGPRLFSVLPTARKKGNRHRRFCLNIRKHFFSHAGDSVLAQVAQGGCGDLGDVQKPSGHGPGQPALGRPAQAGLDKTPSRGPFQPQPFCDSVNT